MDNADALKLNSSLSDSLEVVGLAMSAAVAPTAWSDRLALVLLVVNALILELSSLAAGPLTGMSVGLELP